MAFDFTTLTGLVTVTGSIKYWINYSRIDSEGILAEAEAWIYAKIRVKQMETEADLAILQDAVSVATPTGYLDPIHLCIPGVIPRIRYTDNQRFKTELGYDDTAVLPVGPATRYTVEGAASQADACLLRFNSKSDAAYTAKFSFFKRPTALGGSNTTNWLTIKYPTLLRRVCLMFAAEARKEWDTYDRAQVTALAQIDEIKVESDLGNRGMEMDFNWEDEGG